MPDNRKELSRYRLELAIDKLGTAGLLLREDKYKDCVNRSYYSLFHAIRSLFALEGIDFKKHSAVISYFRQKYIKTDVFDKELSVIIGDAFLIRNQSDYEDFFTVSKAQAKEQYSNAIRFVGCIEEYLRKEQII